jgi:hypothetical protein
VLRAPESESSSTTTLLRLLVLAGVLKEVLKVLKVLRAPPRVPLLLPPSVT